ncbi:MAG: F0F1 ATP synthase subunit A [Candidatus Omnitrophica bacterium]|nr:F0F1 ATP synthase subunit A [Candidatus Omnitrophota bacterium]
MKKLIITIGLILFFAWQFHLAMHITPDLSEVGKPPHKIHELFGVHIPFGGINVHTILTTWIVIGILVLMSLFLLDKPQIVPSRTQAFLELIIEAFLKLCEDTLGSKLGRKYFPYVMTVFLFIICSNYLALLPFHLFEDKPTRDLNTTLGMGLLAFFVAHLSGIRIKGFLGYLKHYFEPFIKIGKWEIPNFIFAPLHIVGEVGKVVSHSFRLFGNITGETIIIVVVTNLVHFWLLPPVLSVYFIMLIGAIQAFVFTMLALTYLSIQIRHDDEEEHADVIDLEKGPLISEHEAHAVAGAGKH